MAPGERIDVIVDATEVGIWAYHCHILTHAEGPDGMFGMVTALIVGGVMVVAAMDARPMPDGFVRLSASTRLRAPPTRVAWAILDDCSQPWPGGLVAAPGEPELRRSGRPAAAIGGTRPRSPRSGKAAYLDLAAAPRARRRLAGGDRLARSTAGAALPGLLRLADVGPDELRIDGLYAPPGGALGRVADRVLLHIAAEATARWLLGEIDARCAATWLPAGGSSPRWCLATNAAACVRRWRLSFDRMLLT